MPTVESHFTIILTSPQGDGYINESGLPLYYRAFVYKLPK
ncbi:hypothetical protein M989_00472 [Kluyvera georgiana ATCC 51603]|uniref:Uncharacterized protein n=1 Tax=Kluyvera georgiana ATCC 51603 TaxID=1354264 RepID=A0A1B7K768_9ENTR|nr:hypothetical protein M989_00472 [Kluyvera georgiana ATCC 51603]